MRENLTQTRAPNPFETGALESFRFHVERTKRAIHRVIAAPPLIAARWQEEVEGSILNDSKPELTSNYSHAKGIVHRNMSNGDDSTSTFSFITFITLKIEFSAL